MGAGAGTDLTFVNMVVMKDSFETGLRHAVRHGAASGVRADEIERQRQQMLSGLQVSFEDPDYIANAVFDRLVYGFHPVRHAADTARRRRSRRSRATICVAFHDALLRAEQRDPRDRRRRHRRGSVRRRAKRVFGDWERRDVAGADRSSSRRSRRAASSSSTSRTRCRPRCASATSASRASIPTTWRSNLAIRILGGEGSNRLHQVLRTERGLTYGAQADMRHAEGDRRLRGRDQHAIRGDRRGAAADRRRVLAAAARARRRARAGGRARRT